MTSASAGASELRHLQYAEDARQGVGKRNRRTLAEEYVRRYQSEILSCGSLASLISQMPTIAPAALLCVERDPEACHRSLIARRLAEQFGVPVEHLRPN